MSSLSLINVVFDSNIVIDALRPNHLFAMNAKRVFDLVKDDLIAPFICANSLTDIYYVLRKVQGNEKAKDTISSLLRIFDIIPLTEEDCVKALTLPMNDFEDAIIAVCAKKVNADYIVTRDEDFIKAKTGVNVVTSEDLVRGVGYNPES